MTLAAAHVPPLIAVPLAAAVLGVVVWYWRRLGREGVPETRRRIRRASMIVMAVAIFVFLGAASFIDGDTDPTRYAVTWAMAITLLLIIVLIAVIDMINNLRIHRREAAKIRGRARENLLDAIEDAKTGRTPSTHRPGASQSGNDA